MGFPLTSYIPAGTIQGILNGTIALTGPLPVKIGAASSDSLKVALYSNSVTATEASTGQAYNSTGFNTFEVTGTNWSAGGVALSGVNNGLSIPATGVVMLDAGDVSVASTTLSTPVFGCMLYDDTIAVGTAKAALAVIYFNNPSGYTTNNGTFGITWDANGIWRITLH